MVDFGLQVVFRQHPVARVQPNVLEFALLVLFGGLFFFFGLLVLVLAVVHDLADRRLGLWCHFDQVNPALAGDEQCVARRHDAELAAIVVNNADLAGAYPLIHVDPWLARVPAKVSAVDVLGPHPLEKVGVRGPTPSEFYYSAFGTKMSMPRQEMSRALPRDFQRCVVGQAVNIQVTVHGEDARQSPAFHRADQ